jgi:hypothetical protein
VGCNGAAHNRCSKARPGDDFPKMDMVFELHRRRNERVWWQKHGIDPLVIAASLWAKTHAATPMTSLAVDIDRPANVNGSDLGAHLSQKNAKRSQFFARRRNDLLPSNRA